MIAVLHARLIVEVAESNNEHANARSAVLPFDHEHARGRPRYIERQNIEEDLNLALSLDLLPEELLLLLFTHIVLNLNSLLQ